MFRTRRIKKPCFSGNLNQNLNIDIDRYITQPNWLNQLARLCCQNNPALPRNFFDRHVSSVSTYGQKEELLKTLKFHYAVLSGALNQDHPQFAFSETQKKAIILKLSEEYYACSPGFHNRANSILEGYFLPKTISEIFVSIRQDIVERLANQNTSDVHTKNRFFVVALQMGYNVKPTLAADYYLGYIPDHTIRDKLTRAFKEAFQPFSILLGIKERLSAPFLYVGRKTEGYKISEYGPGLDYLKTLFEENEVSYDYLVMDEESGIIHDIDWDKILANFWQRLIQDGYFDYDETWQGYFKKIKPLAMVSSAFDYVSRNNNHKKEVELVQKIFSDPSYADNSDCSLLSLNNLLTSETECLAYLQCNPNLSNQAKLNIIFNFIAGSADINTNQRYTADGFWRYCAQTPELLDIFATQFSEKYPVIAARIKTAILNENQFIHLLSKRTTSTDTLKILLQQLTLNYFTRDELITLLSRTSWENKNMLMLAITFHPKFFDRLLSVSELYGIKSQLLAQNTGNVNCLSLALEHRPELVPKIFNECRTLRPHEQRNIFQTSLQTAQRLESDFTPMLQLQIKVTQLSLHPDRKQAFDAASQLLNSLSDLLQESNFVALRPQWDAAISEARLVLGKHRSWQMLLANLALLAISIPLLGLPLIARYYSKKCKYVLFQTKTTYLLDNLENLHSNLSVRQQSMGA